MTKDCQRIRGLVHDTDGVYIRVLGSTKPSHWLPHFVPNTLLLPEIYYETYVNGVATSFHRNNKGLWTRFPLSNFFCKIENLKQAKDEVCMLISYEFKEVTF